MQFALGSVLKLTRSAFGGLGSFRAPSIRRALPVLLGGLLCAVGSTAMAQTTINRISLTSTPSGGPSTNPKSVYVIGDTIRFAIDYSEDLTGDPGSPTLRFQIGSQNRAAACAWHSSSRERILCSYVVKEGDGVTEVDSNANISVNPNGELIGGNVPDRSPPPLPDNSVTAVDGIRLKLNSIAVSGGVQSGGASIGFNAGSTIGLTLQFGDGTTGEAGIANSGTLAATLVLQNAERATRYVSTGATPGNVEFEYRVVAGDNGAFGLKLTGVEALTDMNGNVGLATGWESALAENVAGLDSEERRVDTRGPRVSKIRITDPVEGTVSGVRGSNAITFDVTFDEAVVAGGASLRVNIGNDNTSANCTNAAASDKLTCAVTVTEGASGAISTPANPLNFDFLRDDLGNDATPTFPAQRLSDVDVDAVRPTLTSATIRVPRAEINGNVIVRVTFSEDVNVTTDTTAPTAVISFTDNDGNVENGIVTGAAEYAYVSGRVVEFRAQIQDLPNRDEAKTSVIGKLVSVGVAGIADLAGNTLAPITSADVGETAAGKTGVSITLKAEPSDNSDQYADNTAPTLERISLGGTVRKVYGIGDPIAFDLLFSEPVMVDGDADDDVAVALRIGSDLVPGLAIPSGTESKFTTSEHSLEEGKYNGSLSVSGILLPDDGDRILDISKVEILNRDVKDAPACAPDDLDQDGQDDDAACDGRGWINDAGNNDGSVPGRTKTTRISKSLSGSATVDTKRPEIESVRLLAAPAPSATGRDGQRYYGEGDVIRIQVTMSEDVTVDHADGGAPKLGLDIGSGTNGVANRYAGFEAMSGKRNLIFEYKVVSGDTDRNGMQVTAIVKNDEASALDGQEHKDSAIIKDMAGNGCAADCGFRTWASTRSARHAVDGSISGDQAVAPILEESGQQPQTVAVRTTTVVRSTTPTGGYYKVGDTITIEVSLSPAVTFTSAPQLLVNFDEGGSQRLTPAERISSSGTPTTRLTYSYRVASGDEDLDGFTGSLSGGGTATVEDGRRATLGSVSVSGIRIDALAPELDSLRITSSAGSDGTYSVGDNIVVTATFSEDVERQGTTDPSVPIQVGETTRTATLQSPNATSGGDTWVFSYKVVAGDNDADGVSIDANELDGDLEDAAGNAADIAHSAVSASTSHKVDTQGPSVTAVAVTGAGDDDLFLEGDTITATVTFDEEVDVARTGTNAVRVRFNIGTEPQTATYASGDGTETLMFTYVVADGDTGQISLPADALQGEVEDAAGNEAEGTLALSGGPYTVDASAPMLVEAPSITSSPPNGGDTYAVDDTITLQVRFDEPVMVTGEPRLPMWVGERLRNIVVYTSGSGTDTLTFSYTVRNGDNDDDGVSVDANALRLPSGVTIQDVNGLTATIEHGEMPNQSGHKVDAIAPGIESVAITSTPASDDAYLIDETIEVTVTFSEDIATDGTPTLDLMVGEGVRAAACAQGSAGTQLTCSYTVVANDFDADGISVDADMLKGTITDMVGNPATLTHEALEDDPAHKVYAAAPEAVRTIDRLSLAAGGGTNSLDLTGIFTGFQLSYAAVSSNESVATATVSGTDLTVVSGMEGTARVTVTASNLAGEASVSFDVLVATDPAETAVLNDALAAIGRSMLSSTASVIGSRFELASTGSQMALGGSRFGGSLSPQMQRFLAGNDPFALEERMSERALFSGSGSQQAYGGGYGLTADRLFTGTSFNMPLNAMGTGDAQFAVWGAGDLQSFEGEPDDGMYDGSSSSGYIGVDARGDGWLAGVSVSRSGAEADYDFDGLVEGRNTGGTLETSVTAFHPYARLEVGADSEVWVIGGFGGGEADLSRTHVTGSQSSDLSMAMAVGGLRRALAMEFGGADLSLRGDAGFLSLETDSGMMAVDGLSASVSRLRLGLEAAWEGESATPFVEVSGRFDGGDGQTGGGLELAGGLRILNPESGFGLEAKGRILAMHTGDGYSESGIGVTASFEPGAAGRGITFRLSPRWGGSADSTDLFWDEVGNVRDASQYAYGLDRAQTWGVDAALGYGFGLRSMPGVVTPFGQMDVTGDQDQRIRVGVRYGLMQGLLGGTQVELSAERVDGEMHRVGETRVLVSGRARF